MWTLGRVQQLGCWALKLNAVDKRTIEKCEKEAALNNKDSFYLAYLTDKTDAERKRGITITTTLINISTSKFNLNILDCPGHRDFIKNMVTGAAQADVGVVIVPASGFESCVGVGGMLKSHIMIAGVLGCNKLIICVNKMDEIDEDKRVEKFQEVSKEMLRIVKSSHRDRNPIIIPMSAFKGINLVNNGEKFEWFKGWKETKDSEAVFTLEQALDYQQMPPRFFDKPLRMPIVGIHKIGGIGTVYTGRVDSGTIVPNTKVTIQPAGVHTEVKTLEIHRQARTKVEAGENCGIALKNASKGDIAHVKTGNVISKDDDEGIKMYAAAVAKVIVVDKPTGLSVGYIPIMDLGTVHVPVKVAKIISKLSSNKEVVENPAQVENHESFTGILIPQKPTVMECMESFPSLGRFAIRDSNAVVCIGSITKLLTVEELQKQHGIDLSVKAEDAKKVTRKK